MRRHATAAVGAALLILSACGGTDDGPIADQPVDDAPDAEAPADDAPDAEAPAEADDEAGGEMGDPPQDDGTGSSDPLLGPEVETALDDATERSGVPRDELLVTTTELVTWPDGAAGCPEPDMMYTQALVDGFRIVIEANGEAYHYVGENGSDPAYCQNPQHPVG